MRRNPDLPADFLTHAADLARIRLPEPARGSGDTTAWGVRILRERNGEGCGGGPWVCVLAALRGFMPMR